MLIVGAGEPGHIHTWVLARQRDDSDIVVADQEEDKAAEVVARQGQGKAQAVNLNGSVRGTAADG
ncbi:MAG: saccharopine dehydrogenase NADP-binding domain-containing protein [Thermoleophilia bacterium]|nr:saccharopine dehydrogenase NADP-binding domain-containing protein [Thermoleophilia bacterium]